MATSLTWPIQLESFAQLVFTLNTHPFQHSFMLTSPSTNKTHHTHSKCPNPKSAVIFCLNPTETQNAPDAPHTKTHSSHPRPKICRPAHPHPTFPMPKPPQAPRRPDTIPASNAEPNPPEKKTPGYLMSCQNKCRRRRQGMPVNRNQRGEKKRRRGEKKGEKTPPPFPCSAAQCSNSNKEMIEITPSVPAPPHKPAQQPPVPPGSPAPHRHPP